MKDVGALLDRPARRASHRTQWAAQFAVASELCKRGYEVALTMGNHPSVDLMIFSPSGQAFGIDVKGLYRTNFWAIKPKALRENLFYVLAFVPNEGPNEFFILDQVTINAEIEAEIARARERAETKGNADARPDAFPGVGWKFARRFQDWTVLPG